MSSLHVDSAPVFGFLLYLLGKFSCACYAGGDAPRSTVGEGLAGDRQRPFWLGNAFTKAPQPAMATPQGFALLLEQQVVATSGVPKAAYGSGMCF